MISFIQKKGWQTYRNLKRLLSVWIAVLEPIPLSFVVCEGLISLRHLHEHLFSNLITWIFVWMIFK